MPPTLSLDLGLIPRPDGRGEGPSVASDGQSIAWSLVGKDTDTGPTVPDLAVFVPGTDTVPRIVYRLPDRDSIIWQVAVRGGRYAFLEMNQRKLGENGWRLWLLPTDDAKAVLLDSSDERAADGRPAAAFALTRDGVVWTVVHDRKGVPTFEMWSAAADGSDRRKLLSSPAQVRQLWYPSADPAGTGIVYATVEPAGDAFAFRIWRLALVDPAAQPVQIGTSDDATNPVTNGAQVVWRSVDENASMASLDLLVAGGDGTDPVSVATPGIVHLSVGNRFAAFDSTEEQVLNLYDVDLHQLVSVERYDNESPRSFQARWTIVAGDLLVFRRVAREDSGLGPEMVWARLPGAGQ